jgi:hypothetical protein
MIPMIMPMVRASAKTLGFVKTPRGPMGLNISPSNLPFAGGSGDSPITPLKLSLIKIPLFSPLPAPQRFLRAK